MRALRLGLPGAVLVAVGWMSATDRLPRNLFAGIRIPSTLRSDEAWRAGHRAAAPALTVAGLGAIAAAVAGAASDSASPSTGDQPSLLSRLAAGWLLAWVGVATYQANRAARATATT